MSTSSRWSIASAKAELSRVVRQAQRGPQIIERRGEPVAIVLAVDDYEHVSKEDEVASRWRSLLATSAAIRGDGGATLAISPRRARRSPFSSAR